MSDFRIQYGMALGPEGTYAANSAKTLITPGDTTPDVSTGVLFYTNNTSATAISDFDVYGSGGINGDSQHEGKVITVFFRDALTTITPSSAVNTVGGGSAMPAGTVSEFLLHDGTWSEIQRVTPSASGVAQSVTLAGSAAPSVAGVEVLLVTATGALTFMGFSGGAVGQRIIVMKNVISAGTAANFITNANVYLSGTANMVLNDSSAYQFVCDSVSRFRMVGPATIP